jgi:predicted transcriptional regulator
MTTNEYAGKVAELIDARPRQIDLDKLLHEIFVLAKIAESRRDQEEGRWVTSEQMREKLQKKFSSDPAKRNGRQKNPKTVAYAQTIVEYIKARPRGVNLEQLLDEISFHAEIAESEREIKAGRWSTPEQVMERMWNLIYAKSDGRPARKGSSGKSTRKMQQLHA